MESLSLEIGNCFALEGKATIRGITLLKGEGLGPLHIFWVGLSAPTIPLFGFRLLHPHPPHVPAHYSARTAPTGSSGCTISCRSSQRHVAAREARFADS